MKKSLQLLLALLFVQHSMAGEIDEKAVVRNERPKHWTTFSLSQVQLLPGSPFYQAMLVSQQYLLDMDPNRMLARSRKRAGLPEPGSYPGSNQPQATRPGDRDHYLSGISLMYAQTGDPRFLERVNYLVASLKECRDRIAEKEPKTGLAKSGINPNFEKILEGKLTLDGGDESGYPWGGTTGNDWYGIHKYMAALRDAYLYCNNTTAFEMLVEYADPILYFALKANPDLFDDMLDLEHGGMNEVFADLYALTGNKKYMEVSVKFNHQKVILNIANGKDVLYGRHANMQVPTFVGTARQYQLTGDPVAEKATANFLQMVYRDHTSAIGGNGCYERFGRPGEITKRLGYTSNETCNTYNMLKVALNYFESTGDLQQMQYFERALYNHILASQDPQSGGVTYYTALGPGCFKSYSRGFDLEGVWCCVGTGMENHSKYGEAIYFNNGKDLYVNLFISSELNWQEKGLKLKMETKFPEADLVRLQVSENKSFSKQIYIRNPAWLKRTPRVWINDKPVTVDAEPGEYIRLTGNWKAGDEIRLELPQDFYLEPAPDDPNMVAVFHGPLALAGELGRDRMPANDLVRNALVENRTWIIPKEDIPVLIASRINLSWLQPTGNTLQYKTVKAGVLNGKQRDVTLVPFYKMHHQRYTVYWKMFTPEEAALRAAIVSDEVNTASAADEKAHKLQGERTDTSSNRDERNFWERNRPGRFARDGWFSYELKVNKNHDRQYLVATYWGGASRANAFDVLVDDVLIGSEAMDQHWPLTFYEEKYVLPGALMKGKDKVKVTFRARSGKTAGGVYGLKITANPVAFPGYAFYE